MSAEFLAHALGGRRSGSGWMALYARAGQKAGVLRAWQPQKEDFPDIGPLK